MAQFRFIVLDVGQGTGNFLEVVDGSNIPTNAFLMDLGSEQWKEIAGFPSAQFVATELQKMPNPTLDAVFLSHSDSDHINLIIELLGYFDPVLGPYTGKPRLSIPAVYYGGDPAKYRKGNINFLNVLKAYRPGGTSNLHYFENDDTSFRSDDPNKWVPLVNTAGVGVYLLVGNTIAEDVQIYSGSSTGHSPSIGYNINTKSLVLLVHYPDTSTGTQILVTGDATGLTLAKCNEIMAKSGVLGYLKNVFSITLPHHGSDTTAFDLLGATDDDIEMKDLAEMNVGEFVANVKPRTISASAGERGTFRHPSYKVVDAFDTYLAPDVYFIDEALKKQGEDTHFYSAYFKSRCKKCSGLTAAEWPSKTQWYTVRTSRNIFTTDYYIPLCDDGVRIGAGNPLVVYKALKTYNPAPPRGVAWCFQLEVNQPPKIYLWLKRATVAALVRAGVFPQALLEQEGEFIMVPSAPAPRLAPQAARIVVGPAPGGPEPPGGLRLIP